MTAIAPTARPRGRPRGWPPGSARPGPAAELLARLADPGVDQAQPGGAARLQHPADDVRPAVHLRVRRRDLRLAARLPACSRCPASSCRTRCSPRWTPAMGLSTDLDKGVFDRFRSLPIARLAPLAGADPRPTWSAGLGDRAAAGRRAWPWASGSAPPRCRLLGAFLPAADLRPGRVLGHRARRHDGGQPGEGADLRLRGAVPADLRQRRVRPDRARCRAGCRPG